MKLRHLFRSVVVLLVWFGAISPVLAQNDGNRFLISPRDFAPTLHAVLVNDVLQENGDIYQTVDRPRVRGNLVAAFMDPIDAARLAQNRPDLFVEEDMPVEPAAGAAVAAWSPDRMDQRVGIDGFYLPPLIQNCGENRPFVYICDTGVLAEHNEFVKAGARLNMAGSYIPATLPRTIPAWQDPWDHGTGVAGCAVGESTGAGRGPANLVSAVCYPDPGAFPPGTFASYAADVIYWALNEHNNRSLDNDIYNDASVLIFASSTTTGPSAILDLAVQRAYLAGMTVVVSAGNQNQDAVNTSPAGAIHPSHGDITLTVAASTQLDARWANSNYGPMVEMFAPGDQVPYASATGVNVCLQQSGTSFSAGYVGGVAARILARNPLATPAGVTKALTDLTDTTYGPSGPFGAGMNGVPRLLYVSPKSEPCVPADYSRWEGLYGQTLDLTGDPDCDGIVNLLEYFMALHPTQSVAAEDSPSVTKVGGEALFRFRRANYVCGVTFEVQLSTDLNNWTAVPEGDIVEDVAAPCINGATWMVTKIPTGLDRNFVRLKVVRNSGGSGSPADGGLQGAGSG